MMHVREGVDKVLACDTSTLVGSVALLEGGRPTCEITVMSPRKGHHSRRLLADISAVLERRELSPNDIDLLVTSVGPGSFTGVRIAIATMQGLATGLGAPLVGACSLDALAAPMLGLGLPVLAALDARRHEIYAAMYDDDGRTLHGPAAVDPQSAALWRAEPGKVLCVGEGVLAYRDVFQRAMGDDALIPPSPLHVVRASFLAAAGLDHPIERVAPMYLRRSEAEVALEAGSLGRAGGSPRRDRGRSG